MSTAVRRHTYTQRRRTKMGPMSLSALLLITMSCTKMEAVVNGWSVTALSATTIRGPNRYSSQLFATSAPSFRSVKDVFSSSALDQVQTLAAAVAKATPMDDDDDDYEEEEVKPDRRKKEVSLTAGLDDNVGTSSRAKTVQSALANLERDMQLLDTLAGEKPQISTLEFTLLSLSVLAASTSPLIGSQKLIEVIGPASAAFAACIGIGAEYVGKVAVADGKEVAAATIQCSAEAEGFLANAERVKAVTPLCVGVGATAATFALLTPVLIQTFGYANNLQVVVEVYLFCPLVSVLAAAVASLALEETRSYTRRAMSVGNRRFAKSGLVGRTWLSSTEMIGNKSRSTSERWRSFAASVLPAPLVGALVPHAALSTKTIIVAALAAAQSALYLSQAEYAVARATDAVALKARSAAVCDTYANQGARSAAILPFTSALSSLCAAATAAIVELPFLDSLSEIGGLTGVAGQVLLVGLFPTLSALFAGAASVSKARCEVDAEAATQAASTLALEYNPGKEEDDPVLRPFRGLAELIQLTYESGRRSFARKVIKPLRQVLRSFFQFFQPRQN